MDMDEKKMEICDSEENDRQKKENEDLEVWKSVFAKLNSFQNEIFSECISTKGGGLSLPLGSGKTILALLLSLYLRGTRDRPILIVVSKTLLQSWEIEIEKFFGKDVLRYQVLHTDNVANMSAWTLNENTQMVLTTADVIGRSYRKAEVRQLFVDQIYFRQTAIYENIYRRPNRPFLTHQIGEGLLFSIEWSCLIVDEIQKYSNIDTQWCQGIGAICSEHRWGLSGTIFDEPKVNNILGFCVILDLPNEPRSLPEMKRRIWHDRSFKGLNQYLIVRKTNEAFIPPRINEHIISHSLEYEERVVYETLKQSLVRISDQARQAKLHQNSDELKMLNSRKLTMILYLRETLVCPMLPIASVIVSCCDFKNRDSLSNVILSELKKLKLDDWIHNENSVISSRMKKLIECVNKHLDDKVILFACFASFLNLMEYYLKNNLIGLVGAREIFQMKASMSSTQRKELLQKFKNSTNGILLISYSLGAEGLNLQFASTVLLTDFWWNASKTQQAIGRIFRPGQIRDEINVYFFTSNTGIEKILFLKQKAKLNLIEEMKTGQVKTKIPRISMDQVIRLINLAENTDLLQKINFY